MLLPIAQVLGRDATDKGVSWVAVSQKRADRQQDFGDGECRTPVVLEYIQTDGALTVDVAVVDAGLEHHFGWFEGIFR